MYKSHMHSVETILWIWVFSRVRDMQFPFSLTILVSSSHPLLPIGRLITQGKHDNLQSMCPLPVKVGRLGVFNAFWRKVFSTACGFICMKLDHKLKSSCPSKVPRWTQRIQWESGLVLHWGKDWYRCQWGSQISKFMCKSWASKADVEAMCIWGVAKAIGGDDNYWVFVFWFWQYCFELRVSHLQGRLSTPWALPPPPCCCSME
jgi:hypothetical protein